MKKLFTLLCLQFFCTATYAQFVIFSQDFEHYNSYTITGWNTSEHTGSEPWRTGVAYYVGGDCFDVPGKENRVAAITDCGGIKTPVNPDNSNVFLVSPKIDLTTHTAVWLRYDSYYKQTKIKDIPEKATVEISIDSGKTWTVIQTATAIKTHNFETNFIDLSAYAGNSDVRLGFRYSDGGGHNTGWAIDNIQVFAPARNDIQMVYVTPTERLKSYFLLNTPIKHSARVFNYGTDTITSFTLKYYVNNGNVYSQNATGISIPPFTALDVMHNISHTINKDGEHNITMWAELPGDPYHFNDTGRTTIRGAHFMPDKQLVIEEGTATWNEYCPRGWVYMNSLKNGDYNIIPISVHSGDPMEIEAYSDWLFNLDWNYTPYFLFDRRENVPANNFYDALDEQQFLFGFADMELKSSISYNTVTVEATVKPAIDLYGDYRLVLVITEDSVKDTKPGWAQANMYAGGVAGTMDGFENKPNPVPANEMVYNFVARGVFPSPEGERNKLPAYMHYGGTYSHKLVAYLNPEHNKKKMKGIVLLINNDDSTILNAKYIDWPTQVPEENGPVIVNYTESARLYPNPAENVVKYEFILNEEKQVALYITDISGRIISQSQEKIYGKGEHYIDINISSMPSGVYFISVIKQKERETYKLTVLH